jgi:protease IV
MSSSPRPNVFVRAARGTWATLDFTRRLVLNLLFLGLVLLFLLLFFGRSPALEPRSALVIAPAGMLVEQFSIDPLSRALGRLTGEEMPEVQLRDVLRAIDAAAADPRIERIVLRPDALAGGGFAALREIAAALRDFRAGGKQVLAYADNMEQRQYLLAAAADEVYLHPEGMFWLEGLASHRSYFREALQDKLQADVHLFRAGEFKSYGEQFVRDGPSEEALEADRFWLSDLWQRYLEDIAEARGVEPARLQAEINSTALRLRQSGGDLASLAMEQGLVDGLLSEDEFEALVAERGEADDLLGFRQVELHDYIGHLDRELSLADLRPQVAVVVAQGDVLDGDQPAGSIGGRSTAALLREAREDAAVSAVVLRIDTPGGSPFAAEQVRRELDLIRAEGKPVLVSMGNVAASAGYWMAMGGDTIFADPSTITGSIGVFGMLLSFPDTLGKLGVHVDGVATTRLAGGFDPRMPLNPEVGAIFQSVVDKSYGDFIARAANARGVSEEAIDAQARGRVWSGAQAIDRALIDQLGGLQDAIAHAAADAGLDEDGYQVRYVEAAPGTFEQFLLELGANAALRAVTARIDPAAFGLGIALDARSRAELKPLLRWLQPRNGPSFRTVSHCFCAL